VSELTLNDIQVTPLKRIPTSGGDVLQALKISDTGFNGFGEVYFSWVNQGSIKAWKCHQRMTSNLVVPLGKVRFVFCLPENNNDFRIEEIGVDNYVRLTIPPGIWFAFQGRVNPKSLLMNVADILHDPDEVLKKPLNGISYEWNSK